MPFLKRNKTPRCFAHPIDSINTGPGQVTLKRSDYLKKDSQVKIKPERAYISISVMYKTVKSSIKNGVLHMAWSECSYFEFETFAKSKAVEKKV